MQDDILGIWGDEAVTGKSAASDILTRKKSLPVVYALENPLVGEALRARYAQPIEPAAVPAVLELLAQAGAQEYTAQAAVQPTSTRCTRWTPAACWRMATRLGKALWEMAEMLLGRQS